MLCVDTFISLVNDSIKFLVFNLKKIRDTLNSALRLHFDGPLHVGSWYMYVGRCRFEKGNYKLEPIKWVPFGTH